MVYRYELKDNKSYARELERRDQILAKLESQRGIIASASAKRQEAEVAKQKSLELEAEAYLSEAGISDQKTAEAKRAAQDAQRKAEVAEKAAGEAEHLAEVLQVALKQQEKRLAEVRKEAEEELKRRIRSDHEALAKQFVETLGRLSTVYAAEDTLKNAMQAAGVSPTGGVINVFPQSLDPGRQEEHDSRINYIVRELQYYKYPI